MALSDIVNLTITEQSQAITRPGFGTPLILAPTAYTSNLVRTYANQAAMISDGFAVTDPAVLAASAIFAQNPHTTSVKIGKLTSLPSFSATLTPSTSGSSIITFSGRICTPANVAGTPWTFASDNTPTVAEACTGIAAAITALSISGLTATASGTTVTLTGTAGLLFSTTANTVSDGINTLLYQETTADPSTGFATQLANIQAEDPNWYAVASVYSSSVITPIVATYAGANRKLFFAATRDSDVRGAGSGDVASVLKAAGQTHTALLHVKNRLEFGECAWMGLVLPQTPGSETWKFKTLAGVTVGSLTDTEIGFCKTKNCNTYASVGGLSITQEGVVSSGEFIDVIRFIDWLYVNMQLDVMALLASQLKVPYTDQGAMLLENAIRGRLQQGVQAGGLVAGSITVTVPSVASQLPTDRASRYFPGITFFANLAGAIHSVSIAGTVSV